MFVAPLTSATVLGRAALPVARPREPLSATRAARRADLVASLCQVVGVPETAETLEYWQLGTFNAFKPRNAWEDWLGQQVSVFMFRIARAERIERRLRDLQSLRAIDFWEDDQAVAAEQAAAGLIAEPGPTYARLLATPAGCDWLIARWEDLRDIPANSWTEAQKIWVRLVCPARAGVYEAPGFVRQQIAGLQEQRERNRDHDRALRALAEADVSDDVSPALARLRRHRSFLQRQMKWYVDQLRVAPPEHRLDHRYHPEYDRVLLEPHIPPAADAAAAPVESGPAAAALSVEVKPTAAPAEKSKTKPLADLAASPHPSTSPTSAIVGPQAIADDEFAARASGPVAAWAGEHPRRPEVAPELSGQRRRSRRRSA